MSKFRVVMAYTETYEFFVEAEDKDQASDLACEAWGESEGFTQVDDNIETLLIEEGDFTEETTD